MAAPRSLLCTTAFWDAYGDRVLPLIEHRPPQLVDGDDELDLDGVDAAYFSADVWTADIRGFVRALRSAPNLAWMQTATAGVDFPLFRQLIERGVTVTTASGAAAPAIAHTAMMYVLALSRDLPSWTSAQARHEWSPHPIDDLDGAVMGIVGYGPIGQALATLAAAFGMEVRICRRSPRPADAWPTTTDVAELAPIVDWLVLAAPASDETHHLVSREVLATMKPTARIVNVGRGTLIDEGALVEALQQQRLAGAGLDVFSAEPLPDDHPLWDLPRVIVTPHGSGASPGAAARASEIFMDNLTRAAADEPLLYIAD